MSEFTLPRPSARDALPGPCAAMLTAVTFEIGAQEYGLSVADVFEIVPIPSMLTLAGGPPYLVGLLNRRGQYLPVLDCRILIGEPVRYDLDRYIIIAGRAAADAQRVVPLLGLLVDQVCDVRVFETESFMPLSSTMVAPFLRGVARWADHSVLLFGMEQLLALTPSIGVDVT
jgi:purine-binding chemotaxis protein CheW